MGHYSDTVIKGRMLILLQDGCRQMMESGRVFRARRGIDLAHSSAGGDPESMVGGDIDIELWFPADNGGEVDILRLRDAAVDANLAPGTETGPSLPGSLSFSSVSVRGSDVYRCRPEEGFGFCKHSPGQKPVQDLGGYPSIAAPILLAPPVMIIFRASSSMSFFLYY